MPCPATPALHRAQLFTFAQGREYKKAMLPWGGLDVSQIPVVKNKTLRKEGRPPGLCRDWGRSCIGRIGELHGENSGLWHSLVLHILNAGNRGHKRRVRDVHCRSLCARKQKQDWCVMQAKEKRRRVLPWTHDQALQVQPWGSPGCSLGRRNSFWREPRL